MTESEATTLIASEVNKLLWQRLGVLGSLFGIANAIALFALWHSITSEAHDIAAKQVRSTAIEYATQSLNSFTEITNTAKDRIAKLDNSYADLYVKVGEANVGLKQLQSNRKNIENSLSELTTESAKLRLNVESLRTTDVGRIGKLVTLLNTVPAEDVKNLIKAFTDAIPPLDALRTESAATKSRLDGIEPRFKLLDGSVLRNGDTVSIETKTGEGYAISMAMDPSRRGGDARISPATPDNKEVNWILNKR